MQKLSDDRMRMVVKALVSFASLHANTFTVFSDLKLRGNRLNREYNC